MDTTRHQRAGQSRKEPARNSLRSYERYLELARAAASAGDDVGMENYYQHAEHFFAQ
jgi:hypothetical protein